MLGAALTFLPPSNAYIRLMRTEAGHISVRTRKVVLTVHIVSSVAWLGIITVQSVLSGIARTVRESSPLLRSLYETQYAIENLFLGKTSFLVLFSGLTLALSTRWRLIHSRWVVAKLVLTLTVMLIAVTAHRPALENGYEQVLEDRTPAEINENLGIIGLLPS